MTSCARLLAFAAASVAALALAATATGATLSDPNDVSGKLDLRTLTGRSSSGLVTVTVRTWGTWANSVLASPGPNRLVVLFDTDLDGASEYRARIARVGSALVALLSGQGSSFEPIPVTKVNGATARFSFPQDVFAEAVESPDESLRLAATSTYKGSSACTTACKDRAPDAGWLFVPHT
jgi:hypothetical protein